MKNTTLAIITSASLLFTSSATSAAVLDQSQLTEDGGVAFWGELLQAQTFTAGISGRLDQLDMALSETPSTFNELVHVSIVEWNATVPGALLGSTDFYMDDYTGSVDLSSQNISLVSGNQYAFVLSNDLSYYNLPDPYRNTGIDVKWDTDAYTGGSLWTAYSDTNWQERTGTDTLFATYVSAVPVPAAVWLFGSGLAGFLVSGLRKKKAN